MKIKNDQGEEVEVLTPEEVEARVNEAKAALQKENEAAIAQVTQQYEAKMQPITEKLKSLETEKADLEAKINGEGAQGANFKTLKEALDKKSAEIDSISKELGDIKTARNTEQRDTLIKKVAGNDPELVKKILHHWTESLSGMKEGTAEELAQKAESALKLARDNQPIDPLDGVGRGGGKGFDSQSPTGNVEFTGRERALGHKLGITDEDYKKFGSKIPKN